MILKLNYFLITSIKNAILIQGYKLGLFIDTLQMDFYSILEVNVSKYQKEKI